MNFILLFLSIKAIFCLDITMNDKFKILQNAVNEYFKLKDDFPHLFSKLEYLEQEIDVVIRNINHMADLEISEDDLEILDEYFAEYNEMIGLAYDNIERRRFILLGYLKDNLIDYVNVFNKWEEDCYNYNHFKGYVDSLFESVNFEGVHCTNGILA